VDFAGSRAGSPWAQAVYSNARGAHHAHAVPVLARAWLRVIWRCWTDHTAYDPARHLALVRTLHDTGAPEPAPQAS